MKYKWSLSIGLLVLVFDQVSKWLVMKYLIPYKEVIKMTPFLNFVHIRNTGVAFGIFATNQSLLKEVFILLLTTLAILGLFFYLYYIKEINFIKIIACGLILGGALGNFTDRLFRGEVIDFIDFHIDHYHWPAFNVADSTVSLGIFLILLNLAIKGQKVE
jgi:signal peptidase II